MILFGKSHRSIVNVAVEYGDQKMSLSLLHGGDRNWTESPRLRLAEATETELGRTRTVLLPYH